jgi:hypothetical protein
MSSWRSAHTVLFLEEVEPIETVMKEILPLLCGELAATTGRDLFGLRLRRSLPQLASRVQRRGTRLLLQCTLGLHGLQIDWTLRGRGGFT